MMKTTKDKFYKVIGPIDVVLSISDTYPYTTTFRKRNGQSIVGRAVGKTNGDSEYYLEEQ